MSANDLPLLLIGAALGGGGGALGYRGSLQIVNQIAPDTRRAEVVSSYLMFCYAGVSLPVIGIDVLSAIETAGLAEGIFAAFVAALRPQTSPLASIAAPRRWQRRRRIARREDRADQSAARGRLDVGRYWHKSRHAQWAANVRFWGKADMAGCQYVR
jgi:MFS family permease